MMAQTLSVLLVTASTTALPILATTLPPTAVTNDRHGSQVLGVCRETVSNFSRTYCEKRQESEVCLKLKGLVSSQYTYLHKLYLSMLAWSETGKEGPRLIALPISYSATHAQLVSTREDTQFTHVCICVN